MNCQTCGADGADVDLDYQAILCPRCLKALNEQHVEDVFRHGGLYHTWLLFRVRGLRRALVVKWLTRTRRYVGPHDRIKQAAK